MAVLKLVTEIALVGNFHLNWWTLFNLFPRMPNETIVTQIEIFRYLELLTGFICILVRSIVSPTHGCAADSIEPK